MTTRSLSSAALARTVLCCALALLALSCGHSQSGTMTLAGSTSVEPFAERLAEVYMPKHPGSKISVQGGGSSAGIRAVTDHICQIGMSSRELKPEETGLREIPIAHDAIVLIVHKSNRVHGVTLEQARAIFSGRITNWKKVGGPDLPITVITREEGSGTRASFEEKVMSVKGSDGKPVVQPFAADALVQDSNGSVREIVASDPAAIGFLSFGLVDQRVRALDLGGVEPTVLTIKSGRYPVVRNFLFLTCGPTDSTTNAFIDFTLGPEGQRTLVEEGLISVR